MSWVRAWLAGMACEIVASGRKVREGKSGHACAVWVYPVVRRLERRQLEVDDEVGGVARGGQRTRPRGGLVDWAVIESVGVLLRQFHRIQPNHRHLNKELRRLRFDQTHA